MLVLCLLAVSAQHLRVPSALPSYPPLVMNMSLLDFLSMEADIQSKRSDMMLYAIHQRDPNAAMGALVDNTPVIPVKMPIDPKSKKTKGNGKGGGKSKGKGSGGVKGIKNNKGKVPVENSDAPVPVPCRHFLKTTGCRMGARCRL